MFINETCYKTRRISTRDFTVCKKINAFFCKLLTYILLLSMQKVQNRKFVGFAILSVFKGQLILKMSFWCIQFFQKWKNNLTWCTIVVKLNLFVRFLEECKMPKRQYEINWPLPLSLPWNTRFFFVPWLLHLNRPHYSSWYTMGLKPVWNHIWILPTR